MVGGKNMAIEIVCFNLEMLFPLLRSFIAPAADDFILWQGFFFGVAFQRSYPIRVY